MSKLIVPTDIPKYHRLRTNAGGGSFCAMYSIEDPVMLEIRKHALLVAASSPLTVVINETPVVLRTGSALLVGFQTIEVSGPGELHLFSFGHRAVRTALERFRIIETLAFNASAEELPPTPLKNFYPEIACQISPSPEHYAENLVEILQALMLDRVHAHAYSYFRKTFYIPRLRMCLALERGLLEEKSGECAFEREFREMLGCSTARWIARRRMEIAEAWIKHGEHDVAEISNALRIPEAELTNTFRELRDTSPDDLVRNRDASRIDLATLSEMIKPAWIPDPPDWELVPVPKHIRDSADGEALVAPEQPQVDPAIAECVANFWNMKSTGIGDIIEVPECLRDALAA